MPDPTPSDARYFPSPAAFRAWLERHHADHDELWVGFHRVSTGQPSLTWREAVDEALCFGWIDGIRKRIDDESYTIRFTPRKKSSIWSAVNMANVERLIAAGRMTPAGLAAYDAKSAEKSVVYSYERSNAALSEPEEAEFRAVPGAYDYFSGRPASYRKAAIWWVISAKRDETRRAHLKTLIELSAQGNDIPHLTRRVPNK